MSMPVPSVLNRPTDAGAFAAQPPDRVVGYDVARALAICGMVLVHFCLAMARDTTTPRPLAWMLHALDGRATATFMLLAGIGVALRMKAAGDAGAARVRRALVRRGWALLAVGFVNLTIWPGDILRIYGVCMFLAAALPWRSRRVLLGIGSAFVAGFIVLFVCVDYGRHWDWHTLEYSGLWTPAGVVRNLFYDGFRSVFPWAGVFVLGGWLGTLPLHDRTVRRKVLCVAVVATVVAEVGSALGVGWFQRHPGALDGESARYLFGTDSMPPLPVFLTAALGAATIVICLCLALADRAAAAAPVRALASTGQMAFTWYVAHIVVGLGTVESLGLIGRCTLTVAAATGLGVFLVIVAISCAWRRFFRRGPLEAVLRRLEG